MIAMNKLQRKAARELGAGRLVDAPALGAHVKRCPDYVVWMLDEGGRHRVYQDGSTKAVVEYDLGGCLSMTGGITGLVRVDLYHVEGNGIMRHQVKVSAMRTLRVRAWEAWADAGICKLESAREFANLGSVLEATQKVMAALVANLNDDEDPPEDMTIVDRVVRTALGILP